MKARNVMTTHVITCHPATPLTEAVTAMLHHQISGLPVVDDQGRLVGIVTEGDFLRRGETDTERRRPRWVEFLMGPGQLADEYVHTHARKIADVMTPEPVTVSPDATLDDVVNLMERHQIKRLPVVRDGRLEGIISRANLLRALASCLPAMPAGATSDHEIRRRLDEEIARKHLAAPGAVEIVVLHGMVHLWGTLTEERTRRAIIVAAENVPGVKGVKDHLAWLDVATGMVFAAPEMAPDRALVS